MPFIEAPTTFYLGRRYDPMTKSLTRDVVYYDSRDLTTHAVVVGMTGSGKTGLCINLLEEAILDNIPAIIIDPKGDITNLLLTFPDLKAEDFQPWINVDDARRANMSVEEYAADTAHRWREGLASWGVVPDRLRWMQAAAKISIFTPGSDAGLPVSILSSLRAPREGWTGNEEALREKISGTVTALLALVGRDAVPLQDKEHVLVANIFEYAWQRGEDLTLEDIILQVQKPPFSKLGVFGLDDYISEKARGKLAMELNNIIAAPSFQSWINGEPMDIQKLLYRSNGSPRVSIFYIAHLEEAERQFIITLLLENMLGWMRTLSGTTSLRALLYIDEMFGYFPPYPRNPPTKEPLLRLLKQARAFGVGLILATQNPADLDYKGLSNAGTWFIGRLQAENDRQRIMTGLRAMASVESQMSLKAVEQMIAQIDQRVFIMHNVNDPEGPVMLHTRWAMSYLRGPLTREQVGVLMRDQRAQLLARIGAAGYTPPPPVTSPAPAANAPYAARAAYYADQQPTAQPAPRRTAAPPPPELPDLPAYEPPHEVQTAPAQTASPVTVTASQPVSSSGVLNGVSVPPGYSDRQPPLSADVAQIFLPHTLSATQAIAAWQQRTNIAPLGGANAVMAYRPVLFAQASIRYQDRKTQLYTTRAHAFQVPEVERTGFIAWQDYEAEAVDPRRVSTEPLVAGIYGDLPPGLADAKRMTAIRREMVDMLYTTARLRVPYSPALNLYAQPDGDFEQFRAQVQQAARERRDAEVDTLTRKTEATLDKLEGRMQRKNQQLSAEEKELASTRREKLFTTGEAVIGLLQGRTAFTLSRMSRAETFRARSEGQVQVHRTDIDQLEQDIDQMQRDFEEQVRALNDKWAKAAVSVEEYLITPYKKDIAVDLFGIGWLPHWYAEINGQPVLMKAY